MKKNHRLIPGWVLLAALFLVSCRSAAHRPDMPAPGGASAPGPAGCLELKEDATSVILSNCLVRITIDKTSGRASFAWGETVRMRGVSSAVRLGRELRVPDAVTHTADIEQAASVQDGLGIGKRVTVTHTFAAETTTLRQNFTIYEQLPYFLLDVEAVDVKPVSSNHMVVLAVDAADAIDLGPAADARILLVPFHNNEFTRYDARALSSSSSGESHEVTAIYDNRSRAGLVLGSVTHDVWKTGISYAGAGEKIESLAVHGGAASAATLDTLPHGAVSGRLIRSPRVLVGYFSDWREGLESFGRANATLAPPLHPWTGGVVFGFNTWAAYKSEVNVSIYQTVSDFLARSLMPRGFGAPSSVFVNWDAGGSSTAEAATYVKGNGQRAGLYSTPFTSWGDGTDPRILKDASGNPLPRSDGGYPLDPTHPEVKSGILSAIRGWKSRGYEYVKLDFVTHGIKEGVFHDKSITTGVAAYNYGLRYIAEEIAGAMFIDLAISPVFPGGQYVHARRVSCDAFGGIGNSEYLMNNAGYGWWLSGNVYQYNDPDHIVLGVSAADGNKVTTVEEARTRVNTAAISGTVFIDSDRLDSDPEAQSRANLLLTNPDINALARRGKAFRPVEGNTGNRAMTVFVSTEAGKAYLALFNFSPSTAAKPTVDLDRAGLDGARAYTVRDLWSHDTSTAKGTLSVTLPPTVSTILELVPAP